MNSCKRSEFKLNRKNLINISKDRLLGRDIGDYVKKIDDCIVSNNSIIEVFNEMVKHISNCILVGGKLDNIPLHNLVVMYDILLLIGKFVIVVDPYGTELYGIYTGFGKTSIIAYNNREYNYTIVREHSGCSEEFSRESILDTMRPTLSNCAIHRSERIIKITTVI